MRIMRIKNIVVLLLSLSFFLGWAVVQGAVSNLEIDLDNMNGHAILKIDEGNREVVKIKVINNKGDLKYNIAGGSDKNLFHFDEESLILSFKKIADFENPKDSNKDNIYRVSINIKDDSRTMRQSFWIHIEDVVYSGAGNQPQKSIRHSRNYNTCKDTRALNFSSTGKHKQELCIYQDDIEKKINLALREIENLKNNIAKKNKYIPKNVLTNINSNRKKKEIGYVGSLMTQEGNSQKITLKKQEEKKDEDMVKLIESVSEDSDKKENQMASVEESDFGEKVAEESNSWFGWILLILIAAAVWLVWKIFKDDDKIDIDRL